MSRRKSRPKLSPIWLPYIRDRLADRMDEKGRRASISQGRDPDDIWESGRRLRESPAWWVSRDMTTLAVDTAEAGDMPDAQPPSDDGFIVFQGGLPFRLAGFADGGSCTVDAIHWIVVRDPALVGDRPWMLGTEVFTREKSFVRAFDPGLPIGYVPMPGGSRLDFLANVLVAVWALSEQPSISESRPPRVTPLDRVPVRYEQTEIPRVKMLTLRENLHRPGEKAEPGEKTREYTHRWIVRGFWREQPYGKGHSLRRRQWIPPFVKGPADKPLIRKETVRIWRR